MWQSLLHFFAKRSIFFLHALYELSDVLTFRTVAYCCTSFLVMCTDASLCQSACTEQFLHFSGKRSRQTVQLEGGLYCNVIIQLCIHPSSLGICKNTVPEAIECQSTGGVDHTMLGQVLTCDRRYGLECRNEDQPNSMPCVDYQIRILCTAKDDGESVFCHLKCR